MAWNRSKLDSLITTRLARIRAGSPLSRSGAGSLDVRGTGSISNNRTLIGEAFTDPGSPADPRPVLAVVRKV
jgi:hypothetical protein